MRKGILLVLAMLVVILNLAGCAKQETEGGASATPSPTTNPMGQPASADTPGAQAEERKAGGY